MIFDTESEQSIALCGMCNSGDDMYEMYSETSYCVICGMPVGSSRSSCCDYCRKDAANNSL